MASVDFLKQFDPDPSMTMLEKDETGTCFFILVIQLMKKMYAIICRIKGIPHKCVFYINCEDLAPKWIKRTKNVGTDPQV